jgi:hypothetical protein
MMNLKRTWKGVLEVFEVLFWHLPGGTEENPEFEPSTSQIQV